MPLDREEQIRALLSYRGQLLTLVYMQTRNMHDAEDIMQDLVVKLMKSEDRFEAAENVYRWAKVVARHAAIDLQRRKGRGAVVIDADVLDLLEIQLDTTGQSSLADDVESLHRCMAELNPDARQLIDMRYREGLTGSQVAERLRRPVKSIYVSISRIYRKLAECIARSEDTSGVSDG